MVPCDRWTRPRTCNRFALAILLLTTTLPPACSRWQEVPGDCAALPHDTELQITLRDGEPIRLHAVRADADSLFGYEDLITPDGASFPAHRVAVPMDDVVKIEHRVDGAGKTAAVAVTAALLGGIGLSTVIWIFFGGWG